MRNNLSKIALTATLWLALASTFGCQGCPGMENFDDVDDDDERLYFTQCEESLFAGGDGTEANPYQISIPKQLQNMNECSGEKNRNNYYVLNNDIDLTKYLSVSGNNDGKGWQPIGGNTDKGVSFYGKFNGNGHKVSGLWINESRKKDVGLFGIIVDAEIKNIGVEIDNAKGGLESKLLYRYDIYIGGLVGRNRGTISNSYVIGNVEGGGLVGSNEGTISNSYVIGDVYYGGGLVWSNEGTVSNSYVIGNVHGGGLVWSNGGTISNSYVIGNVEGGGLVWYNYGTISNSYATGSVTGNYSVGGLVGDNSQKGTISNSYATGSVSGSTNVGGLVGSNNGTISNSYATGSVSGSTNVGGLVGYTYEDTYEGTIISSYYDIQTSGQTDTGKGEGKTTAEMKTQSTFTGWDFENIWEINSAKNNGYPIFRWQLD